MTYDLGRLVGHGLIERTPHSERYRPTPDCLRQAAFLTKLADRVLDPGLARCGPPLPCDCAFSMEPTRWPFTRL
jgi:hypothetical protein